MKPHRRHRPTPTILHLRPRPVALPPEEPAEEACGPPMRRWSGDGETLRRQVVRDFHKVQARRA